MKHRTDAVFGIGDSVQWIIKERNGFFRFVEGIKISNNHRKRGLIFNVGDIIEVASVENKSPLLILHSQPFKNVDWGWVVYDSKDIKRNAVFDVGFGNSGMCIDPIESLRIMVELEEQEEQDV